MRIGFVVNRLRNLRSSYTTTHLAAATVHAGIRTLFIEIDGFTLDPNGRILARAHAVPDGTDRPESLAEAAREGSLPTGLADLEELDALLLRNNPVRRTVLDFARALRERGTLVLNDPDGIAAGAGKLALEALPTHHKPRTVVTCDRQVLRRFVLELDGPAVLKPVRGFGGKGVQLVDPEQEGELDRAIERAAALADGYLVAQELAPQSERGDKRILLVDGEPVGCYTRMRGEGEFLHNIHAGGRPVPSSVDSHDRELCDAMRGRLVDDGIFLAGLDVIGGRAVEVNVVAPGGIANIERTSGTAVAAPIVQRLRRRISRHRTERRPGPRGKGARGDSPGSSYNEGQPAISAERNDPLNR